MHLDTSINTSTVKDCWGVSIQQRLNHLQARRRHLTFDEYYKEKLLIIKRFNDEKSN